MNVSCLCGKTKFQAALKNHDVHACHCSMCRQQSSGVLMSIDVEPSSLKFDNQEYLKLFKSSDWGERGFCSECGTSLFWRTQDGSYCNINVFAMEEQPKDLKLTTEIYIDNKPDFYQFKYSTEKLTEADVIVRRHLRPPPASPP